jgi:hypothetical protein
VGIGDSNTVKDNLDMFVCLLKARGTGVIPYRFLIWAWFNTRGSEHYEEQRREKKEERRKKKEERRKKKEERRKKKDIFFFF